MTYAAHRILVFYSNRGPEDAAFPDELMKSVRRRRWKSPPASGMGETGFISLVWGQGVHLCLGAPLARLEVRVALEELLSRTKRFELAGDAPRREVYPSNGLATLLLRVS